MNDKYKLCESEQAEYDQLLVIIRNYPDVQLVARVKQLRKKLDYIFLECHYMDNL